MYQSICTVARAKSRSIHETPGKNNALTTLAFESTSSGAGVFDVLMLKQFDGKAVISPQLLAHATFSNSLNIDDM